MREGLFIDGAIWRLCARLIASLNQEGQSILSRATVEDPEIDRIDERGTIAANIIGAINKLQAKVKARRLDLCAARCPAKSAKVCDNAE